MGFRAGHTEAAAVKHTWKLTERHSMHLRDFLVGNTMHCPTVGLPVSPTLVSWQLLLELPDAAALEEMEPRPQSKQNPSESARLARMIAHVCIVPNSPRQRDLFRVRPSPLRAEAHLAKHPSQPVELENRHQLLSEY